MSTQQNQNQTMNLAKAAQMIMACIAAKLPCFLHGGPGIGKSDLIRQIALKLGMSLIDLRLSQLSDVDLRGLPCIAEGMTTWVTPSFLPIASRDGERGILLLDELPQALPSVQNAGYQLVLDRRIGDYQLPSGWIVIAAGNNAGDGGFQQRIASPLCNRFAQHVEVTADPELWANWAADNDVSPLIVALIRYRPELLYQFDRQAKAFPTPRSITMFSRLLPHLPADCILEAAQNCCGNGWAVEYYAYSSLIGQLPSLQTIIAQPASSAISNNPGVLYAVCTGLGRLMDASTIKAIMVYLNRLPVEYAVMAIKDAIRRDNSLTSNSEYTRYIIAHQEAFQS